MYKYNFEKLRAMVEQFHIGILSSENLRHEPEVLRRENEGRFSIW